MEVLELVSVTVPEILEHKPSCPFCKENVTPDPLPESKIVDDWDEDTASSCHEAIGNDPKALEKNMSEDRPTTWYLRNSVYKCNGDKIDLGSNHIVKANPHHLIPGNESLKNTPDLLKWIFKSKGLIENDIGYDVNCGKNGIWLPSNNAMRGNLDYACETVKITYANAAQPNGGCFHDRHVDYSKFVIKILANIADRMDGIEINTDCPYKTTESNEEKFLPPWSLVSRLNGVSARLSGLLRSYNLDMGFRPPVYTSRLSLDRVKILINAAKNNDTSIDCPVCKAMK